ncbi:MAG: GntR family transcriptional regulator [Mycoplasmatales bacterium]
MLKKNSSLYIQIHDIIRDNIINGTYQVGEYLPTEKEFAQMYNVSLVTIRKAIELLQNKNCVEKKSGKGTKVVNAGIISSLSTGKSFSQILNGKFDNIEKKMLSVEKLKELDNPLNSKICTKITRIYYVDNDPYIYMENYVAANIEKEKLDSLYQQLHDLGYRFAKFQDSFKVVSGNSEVKTSLNSDGPFLKRTRKTFLDDGSQVEIAVAYYNTEICEYEFEFLTD